MADRSKSRPVLIPPLVKASERLEIMREAPRQRQQRSAEHPHCEEHFLFTPHCAACLEAEKTQRATAHATPMIPKQAAAKAASPDRKSSRSFGFTDNIPEALVHQPTVLEQLLTGRGVQGEAALISCLVDELLDP